LGLFWGGLLILVAGSGFLVYVAIKGYVAERGKLSSVKVNLEALYKMAPFPSKKNVELEKQNLTTLQSALDELQAALARQQVEPPELNRPTVFMESFWQARGDLLNHAKTLGVTLPANFGFGLDAYLGGTPPKPEHVPRLMQQLTMIKSLCDLLFAAKVSSIEAIGREDFESGGAEGETPGAPSAATGRRARRSSEPDSGAHAAVMINNPNAGILTPGTLFAKMRFVLIFKGKEDSVLQVLNALASNGMFVVVNRVNWSAPRDQVSIRKQVFGKDAAGNETAPATGKESRIVSGKASTLTIRLDIDVYRFTRKAE
jgi:hypothetical protein